jgi:TolA-binding protein
MKTRRSKNVKTRVFISLALLVFLVLCLANIFSCLEYAPDEREFEVVLDLMEKKECPQAIQVLEVLLPEVKDAEIKNRYCYVAATCYRNLGQWKEAITYYQSTLEEGDFLFADLSKLHIAESYHDMHNYGLAIEWYEKILTDHPHSHVAVEAQYQLGECYSVTRQYESAIRHYTKFIETYTEESRRRTASYKIGCAYQEQGKLQEACVWFQGMLRHNTRDQFAKDILGKLGAIIADYPEITITREDRLYYGVALYHARKNAASREQLEQALGELDDISAQADFFIAESYFRESKYSNALDRYLLVIQKYPRNGYAIQSKYQIAMCHRRLGNHEKSNSLLENLAAEHPESSWADNALYQIGDNYDSKNQYKDAANAYKKMVETFPRSALADDALWNMSWYYIKLKDYNGAKYGFRWILDKYPDSDFSGAARFWLGIIHERMREWQEAADMYNMSMQNVDWYYSDRARRRMASLVRNGKISEVGLSSDYIRGKVDESVPAWISIHDPVSDRAQKLMDMRIYDDAARELTVAVETAVALESAYYNLGLCYNKMGDFNKVRAYGWRLSQLPGMKSERGEMPLQLYQMLYPIAYKDAVFSNSEKNDLSPLLVLALMLEESRYNPKAISWAGAYGLTQIMPSTGRDIARSLKIQPFNTEMLLQPELNIRMGAWYLGGLVRRFSERVDKILGGNIPESESSYTATMLALGAYNGGETRVRRWIDQYGIEDIDEFVENIPISETKRYIKKVCDSYEVYKSLYIDLSPKKPI